MSFFNRIFNKKQQELKPANIAALIKEPITSFTTWNGDAYENDIYRAGVDAIARNCGKLKGSHILNYSDGKKTGDSKLNRLLQVRPNPYMSAYDFIYKMVTRLYLFNNSFALIERDEKGNVSGFYPITANSVNVLCDEKGKIYCDFTFNDGRRSIFDYSDLIHLRRNFNSNDILGDNNSALNAALELAHTQNEGITAGIKAGANIRGILKFTQIMSPLKLKEEKENFITDYLNMSNDGGVIAVDQKADYIPLENKPVLLNAEQTKAIQTKIYDYLGVTEKIVNSSYDENEFSAFYESTIEPIALSLGMELTSKIFNDRELAYGNSIIFESGRLAYTSNSTKVSLIKELMPMGLLSVNQALEILNLPAVTDGDKRIMSLNYVDEQLAAEYQLNKAGGKK